MSTPEMTVVLNIGVPLYFMNPLTSLSRAVSKKHDVADRASGSARD